MGYGVFAGPAGGTRAFRWANGIGEPLTGLGGTTGSGEVLEQAAAVSFDGIVAGFVLDHDQRQTPVIWTGSNLNVPIMGNRAEAPSGH